MNSMKFMAGALLTSGVMAFAPPMGGVGASPPTRGGVHALSVRASALSAPAVRRPASLGLQLQMGVSDMPLLTNHAQIQGLISKVGAKGYGCVVLYKKEVCRKCAALYPKFVRLQKSTRHSERKLVWVMVNADKLDKTVRSQLGLKSVPAVQFYDKMGVCLEHYDAEGTISCVLGEIDELAEKYGDLEPGLAVASLEELGLAELVPKAKPRPTGRIIRMDSRAGAIAATTSKLAR